MDILMVVALILGGMFLAFLFAGVMIFVFLKGIEIGQEDQKGRIALLYQGYNLSFGYRLLFSILAHFEKIRI